MSRPTIVIVAASLLACLAPAPAGWAQTPDEACAADSLYLISPPGIGLRLSETGRGGLTLSWRDLDQSQATCYTLEETAGLGFGVSVAGGFGDRVDRVLRFTTADSGSVGARQPANLVVNWRNDGPGTYGNLGGSMNLSNNGGVWHYDAAAGSWFQTNGNLPMTWRQTNVRALARGTAGFMVAAFTRGATVDSEPTGLYVFDGANWNRVAPEIFDRNRLVTWLAVSPGDNSRFAVGTRQGGLFLTNDGGQTFTQWRAELDPAYTPLPTNFWVTALNWTQGRLLVAVERFGVFVSADGGASFTRSPFLVPENLNVATPNQIVPVVNDFVLDPSDPDRILAALQFHGVYESLDGAQTWRNRYGNLVVPDTLDTAAWVHSALSAAIDSADPQVIVMGVSQKGLYRTTDGGLTWNRVAADLQPSLGTLTRIALRRAATPGLMFAMEDNHSLLYTTDSGATWDHFPNQPVIKRGIVLLPGPNGGDDLTLGTWNGGIYAAGTPLPLKDTYSSVTSTELRNLDLGLVMTFGAGRAARGDQFSLVAQTFQGWAVWRAPSHLPSQMTLIGLYDRVNPEDCIRGYCGNESFDIIPRCFAAKRAACFDFATPDTVRFFDDEVYNGFAYYYSVTSFDYGNTALTAPENNSNELLFSRRWDGDDLSPFPGTGNRTYILVNESAAPDAGGDEIYAFPNPVRLGAGIPGSEGEQVVFTNLPEGARVRIFTMAGDDVINLGPDNQLRGQIYWNTVNRDGESVAAGIYIYKVEMPQREDYWGRIVVIR